ncbi:hypothetical protein ACHAPT_005347 [Fusarium lateritium]
MTNAHHISSSLDGFRALFNSICDSRSIDTAPAAIEHMTDDDLRNLTLNLLVALRILPAVSGTSHLVKLLSGVASDDFDFDRVKPLLKAALGNPDDELIWNLVASAAVESTPPPRSIPSSIKQTPWTRNTSSLVNSSELRQYIDPILRSELENLYVGLPAFHEIFFGDIPDLNAVSKSVLCKCTEGHDPLFKEGWSEWPTPAIESDVLRWFEGLIPKLEALAGDRSLIPTPRRKLLAQPRTPLEGSVGRRSMDIGFVNSNISSNPESKDSGYRWSDVLVAGELKSNPMADKAWMAWLDLARYAREVLAAQDTRRFVLGFTLCGSLMRVWEFDRLGGIASEQFDINKEDGALLFITTILGFLWMDRDCLGFDPTIITSDGEKYIEIERGGQTEQLVLDHVMKRAPCIAGRATTCWKAHRRGDPQTPIVIKDSWQYTDRDEEGLLIQEATEKGVVNLARYYHHETVRVHDKDDDVQTNIRKGQDVTKATRCRVGPAAFPSGATASGSLPTRTKSSAGVKRPSSEISTALPPRKRSAQATPTNTTGQQLPNRVHRRVILRDYGKPIYKASSRVALLAALESCIEGHESLHNAGLLHRDISTNNLMINEDESNSSSWPAFLIDLDLAIREQRLTTSGSKAKTGTRAFMAVGALLGDQHSFMHDLESFFWVLFWICIHYHSPGNGEPVPRFDDWNYARTEELADLKKGLVIDERDFIKTTEQYFTPFYMPLVPWVNRLRKAVFPNGRRWMTEDSRLYSQMREILQEARKDERVMDLA